MRNADYQGQLEAINKSQGVIVFALDGTIIEINDNLLEILGYEQADLLGKYHSILVERDMVASNEYTDFWSILKSGSYHSGLYKRLGKGGKEAWIQASYNPIFDPSGRVVKVVKFATDVSSNIALAEAFEEAKRHAHVDSATSLPNRAKQHGKGIHSYYASELNASIDSQRKLIEDMRNSFTADDFFLEYQPRYDARQRTVLGAEALVRWMHRKRGRISPAGNY